jgi:hypothetical protein
LQDKQVVEVITTQLELQSQLMVTVQLTQVVLVGVEKVPLILIRMVVQLQVLD